MTTDSPDGPVVLKALCQRCNGTGLAAVPRLHLDLPSGRRPARGHTALNPEPCNDCNGTGRLPFGG